MEQWPVVKAGGRVSQTPLPSVSPHVNPRPEHAFARKKTTPARPRPLAGNHSDPTASEVAPTGSSEQGSRGRRHDVSWATTCTLPPVPRMHRGEAAAVYLRGNAIQPSARTTSCATLEPSAPGEVLATMLKLMRGLLAR